MKNFKTLMFALFAAFILLGQVSTANAAGMKGKTPEQRAEMKSMNLKKDLKLNDDQTMKVKDALVEHYRQEDMCKMKKDKAMMKSDMMRMHDDLNMKMKTVLNEGQYKMYEAKMDMHEDKMEMKKEMRKDKKKMDKKMDKMEDKM